MMEKNAEVQKKFDGRILNTEFNVHRAVVFGSRNNRDERVITHTTPEGVIEESRISPILYKGRLRTTTVEHGKIYNAIELMFREQGKPSHNRVYFTAAHFYDYLTDLSSIRTKKRHRYKDGSHVRDWLSEHLHVMQHVSISKKYWKTKKGSEFSPKPRRLIEAYFIYQHDKKNDSGNTHNGLSWIELDPNIANSIREGNVQPIFYEIANGIKNDMAAIMYPQLTPLLYKSLTFREKVTEVSRMFAFNIKRNDHLLEQLRKAGKHLISLPIPYGKKHDARIIAFEVTKEEGEWILSIAAERIKKQYLVGIQPPTPNIVMIEEMNRHQEMLKRYRDLPDEKKGELQPQIHSVMKERYHGYGRDFAIVDVMEEVFFKKSKTLLLKEPPCKNPYFGAADLRRLSAILSPPHPPLLSQFCPIRTGQKYAAIYIVEKKTE